LAYYVGIYQTVGFTGNASVSLPYFAFSANQ
jgi:hypothetical protein